MPKKLEANVSSLFDLRAELSRKQAESSKRTTATSGNAPLYVKASSNKLFQKEKVAPADKVQQKSRLKEMEALAREEDKRLKEARLKLEEKARLYDKLKCGKQQLDAEQCEQLLVNFEQKIVDERSTAEPCDDTIVAGCSKNDPPDIDDAVDDVTHDDQYEWVDFTDSFGRTRTCRKDDLASFQEADVIADKNRNSCKKSKDAESSLFVGSRDLLSSDMKRELERQEWEREAEAEQKPSASTHYQHVLRDEAWNHGVAYFQFSKDEEERQKQMQALNKLRDQTAEQRKKNESVKDKRKRLLEERLAKVRERKKLKPSDDNLETNLSSDDETTTSADREPVELNAIPLPGQGFANSEFSEILADELRTQKNATHVRPWDVGKKTLLLSQDRWLSKKRDERDSEFAPPTFY